MSKTYIQPEVTINPNDPGGPSEVQTHPAFGVVVLTECFGNRERGAMFASDVSHGSVLNIAVHEAALHRRLNQDRPHPGKLLFSFSMTHAQFAQFITGVGRGAGTPVTIERKPGADGKLESVPGIELPMTKHERHYKEITESAKGHTEALSAVVAKLEENIANNNLRKTELRELVAELRRHCDYLPSSIVFAVKSAQRELEEAVSAAKIEIESFADLKARQLGFDGFRSFAHAADTQPVHAQLMDAARASQM